MCCFMALEHYGFLWANACIGDCSISLSLRSLQSWSIERSSTIVELKANKLVVEANTSHICPLTICYKTSFALLRPWKLNGGVLGFYISQFGYARKIC